MAEILIDLIDVLEKALASGRFKELVTISFAIIAIIALIVFAIIQAIKSWLYRIETDPIVYHAWRIAQFYQDRPLRAEITLAYPNWKTRRINMKNEYPDCDTGKLKHAVREAEYNEFIKLELDREIRELRKFKTRHPTARKRALKLLNQTRRAIPSGILTIIKTGRWFQSERRYTLAYSHKWLGHLIKSDPDPSKTFQAIQANQYQCAYCRRDLNDNIILQAVVTEKNNIVPICQDCLKRMGKN